MQKLKEIQKSIRSKRIHDIRKHEFQITLKSYPRLNDVRMVLEVGCGDGYESELWAQKAPVVVATDISNQRIEKRIPNFVQCSGICLPFRENIFDLFFSSHTLEHANDKQRFIKEAIRVSSENGSIVIVVPTSFWKCVQLISHYIDFFYRGLIGIIVSLGSSNKSFILNEVLLGVLPEIHGKYRNNPEELNAYRKESWLKLLKTCGLQILDSVSTFPYGSLDFTVIPKGNIVRFPSSSIVFITNRKS